MRWQYIALGHQTTPPHQYAHHLILVVLFDTCTTHTNTSTYRVNTVIIGFHCNFSTNTWLTSSRFNFNDFFRNFWNFFFINAISISGRARDNNNCAPRPSRFTLYKIALIRCLDAKFLLQLFLHAPNKLQHCHLDQ